MPEDLDDAGRTGGPDPDRAPTDRDVPTPAEPVLHGAPLVARGPVTGDGAHALRRDAAAAPEAGAGTVAPTRSDADAAAYHEGLLASTHVAIVAPRHRIEKRAPILWTLEGIWSWLILVGLQIGWYYWGDDVMGFWNWVALVVTIPMAFMSIVVAPWWRYVVARWDVSDTAVCSRTGWWTMHLRVAPLSRLQTVYTTRNLFERWFGLSTVHASTASAHGSVQIRGLAKADADRLAEHLLAIADLDKGDAT